ncbi:hypothetical protein [Paenibacillus sp. GCM10028914]|uniref:hypothetical protein n=1 Tax=Paenibacillus sp. GCM10028914 TaxID=3273416 RepID=UPI0036108E54
MTICINKNGDIFEELISISEDQLDETNLDYPITHALVVAKSRQGYLLLFNTWKQQWELAGGPFVKNDEADEIVFWDGEQNIGYIDEIDKELLKFY